MNYTADGRKYWTKEEVDFLTDPKSKLTKEQNKELRELHITKDLNYLLDCIMNDTDPITGKKISEEELENNWGCFYDI